MKSMTTKEAKAAFINDLKNDDFIPTQNVEVTIEGTPAKVETLQPSGKVSDKEAIADARAAKMRAALVQEKKDAKAAKPAKTKKAPKPKKPAPVNPSAAIIGTVIKAKEITKVNFRQGAHNVVDCNEIECIAANATGRRLTLVFKADGNEVMTRKVYKEHFEKMADVFGATI